MSKVALVKSKDSYSGVASSLELIRPELTKKLQKVKTLVIKINFVTTERELATTPYEAVKAFVDFVEPFYKGKIIISEEATFGNTDAAFEKYGFTKLCKKYKNVELLNSSKSDSSKVRLNLLTVPISKVYQKPNFVVSVCRAKTHDTVVVTLSLKNLLVGAIQHGFFKNRFKIHMGKKIHKILAKIAEHVYPDLSIQK